MFRFFLIITGIALLIAVSAVYVHQQSLRVENIFADAKLVNIETRYTHLNKDMVRITFHPVVTLKNADKRNVTFALREGTQVKQFKAGDTIPIMYPSAHPQNARLRSMLEEKTTCFAGACLGGAFILLALFLPRRKGNPE